MQNQYEEQITKDATSTFEGNECRRTLVNFKIQITSVSAKITYTIKGKNTKKQTASGDNKIKKEINKTIQKSEKYI